MDVLITEVNWLAIVVGAVVSFIVGWLWYSPSLFGTKWAEGVGITMTGGSPMSLAVFAQAVSTFLLAWVIGVTASLNSLWLAILIAVTIAGIVKANGLFAQKSKYAIMVEAGYILLMVAIMIGTHAVL